MKVGVIVSQFNSAITERLLEGAERGLKEEKLAYDVVKVPGAFEIPLMAAELASSQNYDALIALGVVIKGETEHYDMICRACVDGVMRVMLDHQMPIAFEVLMVDDIEKAKARSGARNDNNKGYTAVQVVKAMMEKF